MDTGLIYAICAGISFFELLLIYNRTVTTEYKETVDYAFCKILVFFSAFCVVDAFWGLCDAHLPFVNNALFNVATYGYHVMSALSAFFWFGYMIYYMKVSGREKKALSIVKIVILLAQACMIIANVFTKLGFTVDDNMEYATGKIRIYMYCAQFLYYVIILIYAGIYYAKTDGDMRNKYMNAFVFSLVPLGFGIGQYLFYDVAMYSMGFMISAFVIYAFNLTEMRENNLERLVDDKNRNAVIDILTGLNNRRAYEEDLAFYPKVPPEEDFVYVSMDLNELKKANDEAGHDAGDELIKGAAAVISRCLGGYGKIYRTGGDEFVAIIFAKPEKLIEIKKDFIENILSWRGNKVQSLSISAGYVSKYEFPTKTVAEIAEIADERMYKDKAIFYSSKGMDRRGQNEAFSAICSLYKKILKINISTDSYQIITVESKEKVNQMGYSAVLSEWIREFGASGNVHSDDLNRYLDFIDFSNIKRHFEKDESAMTITYRRKEEGIFKQAMMEIIPARDYTPENLSMYLYVKMLE